MIRNWTKKELITFYYGQKFTVQWCGTGFVSIRATDLLFSQSADCIYNVCNFGLILVIWRLACQALFCMYVSCKIWMTSSKVRPSSTRKPGFSLTLTLHIWPGTLLCQTVNCKPALVFCYSDKNRMVVVQKWEMVQGWLTLLFSKTDSFCCYALFVNVPWWAARYSEL